MWGSIVSSALKIISSITTYFSNKQLIDAGKAEQSQEQMQAQSRAQKDAQDVENDINNLSDADLDKLRDKWTRPN